MMELVAVLEAVGRLVPVAVVSGVAGVLLTRWYIKREREPLVRLVSATQSRVLDATMQHGGYYRYDAMIEVTNRLPTHLTVEAAGAYEDDAKKSGLKIREDREGRHPYFVERIILGIPVAPHAGGSTFPTATIRLQVQREDFLPRSFIIRLQVTWISDNTRKDFRFQYVTITV